MTSAAAFKLGRPTPMRNRWSAATPSAGEECRARSESLVAPCVLILLLLRRRDDDAAIGYEPFFTSLKIDGARQFFVAVQGTTRNAWDLLFIDDGLAVLDDGDPSPDQRDIEALPFSRLAGKFRRSG